MTRLSVGYVLLDAAIHLVISRSCHSFDNWSRYKDELDNLQFDYPLRCCSGCIGIWADGYVYEAAGVPVAQGTPMMDPKEESFAWCSEKWGPSGNFGHFR